MQKNSPQDKKQRLETAQIDDKSVLRLISPRLHRKTTSLSYALRL